MINRFFPSQIVEAIDLRFPHAKRQCDSQGQTDQQEIIGQDHSPVLSVLLEMIEHIPSHILTLHGSEFVEYSEAVEAIRAAVNAWKRGEKNYAVQRIPGRRKWCPISLVRKHLSTLSDEGIAPETADLLFISDPQFRDLLRRDITTVNGTFDNGEWKAATVLGGSVVEAFLLDAIKTFDSKNPNQISTAIQRLRAIGKVSKPDTHPFDDWDLHHLIEVSAEVKLISDNTADQCRIAREFRNLVHPGKAVRSAQICDRGTALSTIAAVEHVIRDLSKPRTC